jgi:hypothetical protein
MPAPKNVRSETPGDAEARAESDAEAAEVAKADAAADRADDRAADRAEARAATDTPESIAAKNAELEKRVAETAGNVGSSMALDWGSLTPAAAVMPGYQPTGPLLPDQLDVDPDTIKAPVLTKQGWVLPTNDPRARAMGK